VHEQTVIRILVAGGSPLWLAGLSTLLDREHDFSASATTSGLTLLTDAHRLQPNVVLIDIDVAEKSTADTVQQLNKAAPTSAVVLLTDCTRRDDLQQAIRAGVRGLVSKDSSCANLVEAIRRAARGEHAIDADLAIAGLRTAQNPLTPRERDILKAAAEGATIPEIARQLFLSTGTVRNYLSRIITKTGARNRIDAINIATANEWF
jgi:two-component system response regulator DesR